MSRRVVITGLGVVSGCGVGPEVFWEALRNGPRPPKLISRFAPESFPCRVAYEVDAAVGAKDYVPKAYRKAVKVMARDTELAVIAAAVAVKDASLSTRIHSEAEGTPPTFPSERLGCQIGAGLIPAEVPELAAAFVTAKSPAPTPEELEQANGFSVRAWGTVGEGSGGGMNNLPPLWLLKYLPNMLACHVTILHGAEGPSNTLTCSEASGLLSLGESCRVIERDAAEACFSGGAESKVNLMGMMRQTLLERLAPAKNPAEAARVRPFDPASAGVIPGEGGGILILEEAGAAKARGVRTYASIAGFGAAQSLGGPAFARSAGGDPAPRARGLVLAIRAALRDAGVSPAEIGAVVPQSCGAPASDAAELLALREVFGDRLAALPIIPIPPIVGDCAAGAGGLQAAAAALCLHHRELPSPLRWNGTPFIAAPAEPFDLNRVLVCTGSLAGQNAAMILGRV